MSPALPRQLLAACTLLACSSLPADPVLLVTDVWIREAPPTSQVLAGYMTLTNTAATGVTVTGASSPAFSSIEIHNTELSDGVARMVRLGELNIDPDDSVSLEPGGMHLMLFNPATPLVAGDTVPLVIHAEPGITVDVPATVIRTTRGHHHHHH